MKFSTQLDITRIQTLTDSIFAVAMTILILEIRIPLLLDSGHLTKYFFRNTLSELFIYFISFLTLGVFWIGSHFHHNLITQTDRISSWLNIFFLMMICMIPLSAQFLNHYRHEKLSIHFYCNNLIVASLLHYCMLIYAWKKNYVKPQLTPEYYKNAKHRILIPVYIYFAIILVSFYSTNIAIYLFMIPLVLHILPERGNKELSA